MELTDPLRQMLREANGEPIVLTDPQTQQEYVVLGWRYTNG